MLVASVAWAALLLGAAPRDAHADPPAVEWDPSWQRVQIWEGVAILGMGAASYATEYAFEPPSRPNFRGGILFDDAVRNVFRSSTASGRATAENVSNTLLTLSTFAPFVVDVYLATLSVHQNADVAIQMFLIDLESLGFAGIVSLPAEEFVGRQRPLALDCVPTPTRPCVTNSGDNTSFLSGHAATTATTAGLTCVHHQHLPLYGGGFADLAPCLGMIGVSVATGIERLVADKHWATDVLAGWGVGAVAGYVLPSLLHYGWGPGHPYVVPVPEAYAGGAGLGLAGIF